MLIPSVKFLFRFENISILCLAKNKVYKCTFLYNLFSLSIDDNRLQYYIIYFKFRFTICIHIFPTGFKINKLHFITSDKISNVIVLPQNSMLN